MIKIAPTVPSAIFPSENMNVIFVLERITFLLILVNLCHRIQLQYDFGNAHYPNFAPT